MITAKERLIKVYGIDIIKFLEENEIEVKYKHVHIPHQTQRYKVNTVQTIGHVVQQDSDIVFAYINKDVNGYEIITNSNGRYIFSQWVSNQNYIEVPE